MSNPMDRPKAEKALVRNDGLAQLALLQRSSQLQATLVEIVADKTSVIPIRKVLDWLVV